MDDKDKLLDQLNAFRRAGTMCDIKIRGRPAQGSSSTSEFRAHMAVLAAASPYFMNMFNSGLKETTEREVTLDMDGDIVNMLLEYMYTCNIPIDESIAPRLLPEAGYLQLDRLKERCAKFLLASVTPSNCIEMWSYSDMHNCEQLKHHAWATMCLNFDMVFETAEFLALKKPDLLTLLTDRSLRCRESSVFSGVCNWVRADLENRKQHMKELLPLVRLSCLKKQFLLETVGKEPLVNEDKDCYQIFYNALCTLVSMAPDNSRDRRTVWKADGGWTVASSLIHPMNDCSSVVFNGQIYCAYSHVLVLSAGKWLPIASPSTDVVLGWKLCVVQEGLYAIGVLHGSRDVYKYYASANAWSLVRRTDNASNELVSVTSLGGCIYVAVKISNVVEKFDPNSADAGFTHVCDFPQPGPTQTFSISALDGKLMIAGGYASTTYFNAMSVYDAVASSWQNCATFHQARSHMGITSSDGMVFIAGGYNRECKNVTDVEMLHDGKWTPLPPFPSARRSCGLVVLDKVLYAIGGERAVTDVLMLRLVEDE